LDDAGGAGTSKPYNQKSTYEKIFYYNGKFWKALEISYKNM